MTVSYSETDVESGEDSEDIRLQSAEDQLEDEDHEGQRHRSDRDHVRLEVEDNREHTEDDDMTARDIREETDEEGEGPREHRHNLEGDHDKLHDEGDAGDSQRVDPVVLASEDVGHDEGEDSEDRGEGDITGEVRSTREERHEADNVVDPDKEEERQEERGELSGLLLADLVVGDLLGKEDKFLDDDSAAAWDLSLSDATGSANEDKHEESDAHKHRSDVARQREVEDSVGAPVDLEFLVGVDAIAAAVLLDRLTLGEGGRHSEEEVTVLLVVGHDREGDVDRLNLAAVALPGEDIPMMRVADMMEHQFLDIQTFLTRLIVILSHQVDWHQQANQDTYERKYSHFIPFTRLYINLLVPFPVFCRRRSTAAPKV